MCSAAVRFRKRQDIFAGLSDFKRKQTSSGIIQMYYGKNHEMEIGLCICVHSHNGLPHMFEGLHHKLPHTVHLPCRDDEILWLLLLQHQPHGLKETDREVKTLRDHKDSSAHYAGICPIWSWQTGSEPATLRRGIRPYLWPDVTAEAHGTNSVGKEDRALPQAQCAAGTHKNTHVALSAHAPMHQAGSHTADMTA